MRQVTAIAVSVLLACLALTGTGDAQALQAIQVQGTIQSADCQTGQVTLATAGGNNTFQANGQTAVYVNGTSVSFCSLQSHVGDSATAMLVPTGSSLDLSQINVTAQAAPSGSGSILSSPVAIGIGALLLGGLIGYFVGHQNAPAQTPAYAPTDYNGAGYYPAGYAPAYLPAQYPNDRPYYYQGHRYYRCTGGAWRVDRACVRER